MAVLAKRDGWRFIIGAILEWQHLFGAVIRLIFETEFGATFE